MACEWRRQAAAAGLAVRDLSPLVGSEIAGFDLAAAADAGLIDVLRAACAERTVLLFRGQQALSPTAYLAFAHRFGRHADLHSQRHYCLAEHHEIFVVGNVEEDGKRIGAAKVGLNWHSDHYHLPARGLFTFLHALVVPPVAGATRYANGMAAYDALSDTMRARIENLEVLHSRGRLFRALFPEASEAAMEAERRRHPDVVHRLVRTHPELARKGLFLGGEWGSTILQEEAALFDHLLQHMIADDFVYAHHWQEGDVLMSDNRCSLHRATEWDEAAYIRRLHRIILLEEAAA